jgi:Mn2+/Fe2+ NRAMP family transporter
VANEVCMGWFYSAITMLCIFASEKFHCSFRLRLLNYHLMLIFICFLFFIYLLVQEKQKARTICTGIAAYALLGYVLGVLFNQPKIPLPANVMFPKLSGESIYSLMALLGANVMTHNIYIHSSLVQVGQ